MPLYKDDSCALRDMANSTHCAASPASLYLTQDLGNALSRMSIPQWRYRAGLRFPAKNLGYLRSKFFAIISDQNVCSQINRDRPLGVTSQCNTRDFQISGLFLNSTRVGDHDHSPPLKSQEFDIRKRQEMKRRRIQIKSREGLARARV